MILDQIAADTRLRVEAKKKEISLEEVKRNAQSMEKNTGFPFEMALRKPDLSFICKKSVSVKRNHCRRISLSSDCKGV